MFLEKMRFLTESIPPQYFVIFDLKEKSGKAKK